MHKHLISIAIMFIILSLTAATQAWSQDSDAMSMPKSMDEFVNWHLDRGACGTWVESGVTEDMWVGIPAGLNYTNTNSMRYDTGTKQLFNSHHMVTEDGRVISTGTGLMYWDAERNAPVATGSGFDMGKPYSGTSTLKGMNDRTISWVYTEISQGKTTTYDNTIEYTGPNTRTNTVGMQGASDAPWSTKGIRVNRGGDILKMTRLAGTWDFTMPDGSTQRTEISWIADEHVLKQERHILAEDGSKNSSDLYLMYWNPVDDDISTLYLDDHGTVIHGRIESISVEGDKVTVISRHEGSRYGDLTMSTQMTQVVDDKTLTTSFQHMALDGSPHQLSWSGKSNVSTRVDEKK